MVLTSRYTQKFQNTNFRELQHIIEDKIAGGRGDHARLITLQS